MGLDKLDTAVAIRDLVQEISRKEIQRARPLPRYGNVDSIDYPNSVCYVLFPGDTDAIAVRMGATQPSAVGQVVRVGGVDGDRYLEDVMGTPYAVGPGSDPAYVARTDYTAKGTLLAGAAASTPNALPVGADNFVLTADSTQGLGMKWAAVPAVTSLTAGAGINVSASTGAVTVTNTGVTSLAALGAGISVSASTGAVSVQNTGVTSAVAGTGISVSGGTGAVTFTNTGVTSAVAGTGIGVSGATGAVTFTNAGVTSLIAGTGINVSGGTGAVTVTNAGVTSFAGRAGVVTATAADIGPGTYPSGSYVVPGDVTVGTGAGGEAVKVKAGGANDYAMLGLYGRSATPGTRTAYLGYATGGATELQLKSELSNADINFVTSGTGIVKANGGSLWYTGVPGRPVTSAAVAFDTLTGGAGAGVGNIAASTIQGYNILDNSIGYSKLSGAAVNSITTLAITDSQFTMFRSVSATGTSVDATTGKETDGLTVSNSATRVADTAAYRGQAITNAGMGSTGVQAAGGPGYTGLQPGQYVARIFVRVNSIASTSNVLTLQVTGTAVTNNPSVAVKASELATTYVSVAVPFTITSTTNTVNVILTSNQLPGSTQWWYSHVKVEPFDGLTVAGSIAYFFANASITNAQINDLSAGKITAGTINVDDIYMGAAGHIYLGPDGGSWTKAGKRVELNAGGVYGYGGTTTVAVGPLTQLLNDGTFLLRSAVSGARLELSPSSLKLNDGTNDTVLLNNDGSFTLQSAPSGARMVLTKTTLDAYSSGGVNTLHLDNTGAFKLQSATAGARLELTSSTLKLFSASAQTVTLDGASGQITAILGSIGGWALAATTLTGTNVTLDSAGTVQVGSGASTVGMTQASGFWAGDTSYGASPPFKVSVLGAVTATSGNIGGWQLATHSLTGGSTVLNDSGTISLGTPGASYVQMDPTNGIFVGASTFGAAKFSVTPGGDVVAAGNVTLSGSGVFRTASSGKRWELSSAAYDKLSGWTGNPHEITPASISAYDGGQDWLGNALVLYSPGVTGAQLSNIQLSGGSYDLTAPPVISFQSTTYDFIGSGSTALFHGAVTVTGGITANGDLLVGGRSIGRGYVGGVKTQPATQTVAAGSANTEVAVTGLGNMSIPVISGRRYRVTLRMPGSVTVANDVLRFNLRDGGGSAPSSGSTLIDSMGRVQYSGTAAVTPIVIGEFVAGATGTRHYGVFVARVGGTGGWTMNDGTFDTLCEFEDIGT